MVVLEEASLIVECSVPESIFGDCDSLRFQVAVDFLIYSPSMFFVCSFLNVRLQENPIASENFSEYATMGYNLISTSDVPSCIQSSHQKSPVLLPVNTNTHTNNRRTSTSKSTHDGVIKKGLLDETLAGDHGTIYSPAYVRELELKYEISEKKRKFLSKRVIELAGVDWHIQTDHI